MDKLTTGGCGCGSGCCEPKQQLKQLKVDFLYLDLSVCERCQGTENSLTEAIREVSGVLSAAGYEVVLNSVNITTKALAEEYRFLSSPTIRINGRDIAMEVKESLCTECGDLCGDTVDCRVWVHEGQEYSEPPKAMIVNAVLKAVYGNEGFSGADNGIYVMPENLRIFFEGRQRLEAE